MLDDPPRRNPDDSPAHHRPDAGGRETSTDPDRVFELLSDGRRRHVLYYLAREQTGGATVTELREVISSRLEGDRDDLAVELHHTHLPKLAAAGVVEYDGRSETVRYRGDPLLERCLEYAADRDLERR